MSTDRDIDFVMADLDAPALTPEEATRRRALRRDQSSAAASRHMGALLDGATPEQAARAARASAARVKTLDAAARKIESAMTDLALVLRRGEDHPAYVLLAHALELVEREEAALAGRKARS